MKRFRVFLGKALLATLGKILPNKGFRRLRVHWARMVSKEIDKHANICKGCIISGDGQNLHIGDHSAIGIKCKVGSNLTMGSGIMMGPECIILTQNHKYLIDKKRIEGYEIKPVYVGDGCWIGTRVIILPGAKIGNNCIIGAGAVVPAKEYPDNSLIVGNPAIVKKML